MLSQKRPSSSAIKTYKFAQSANFVVRTAQPPPGSFLEQVLKTVEVQLQSRGLLAAFDSADFHPVWFLAETERNVFLWRHGLSLADRDDFEFWLDPRALVDKRLRQLDQATHSFPGWASELAEPAPRDAERGYLASFIEMLSKIEAHAHALSIVASVLGAESAGARSRILLPVHRREAKADDRTEGESERPQK
jgi:hypothetical protein